MINRFKGVIPIVVTPFKRNGDIDIESSIKLVDYLIKNGAAALFILGSASEGFLLDNDQSCEVVYAMADANKGRVPLIAGCSSIEPRNIYNFFKRTENADIHGIHYIPVDLKIGDKQLIYLIESYADRSPFPMYLYHNIKRGRALSYEIIEKLRLHKNIHGMKVGGYDKDEMTAFLQLEDESFQILGSGGGQFFLWLELGAEAVTASSACCFPHEFKKIFDDYMAGNIDEAYQRQRWWQEFHNSIPNTAPDNGEYAAEEKYILKKLGVIKNDFCHFPFRQLNDKEKALVDQAIERFYQN
jgi:dihydrodipicolinate synthase/N-acetylneuraminate lyase